MDVQTDLRSAKEDGRDFVEGGLLVDFFLELWAFEEFLAQPLFDFLLLEVRRPRPDGAGWLKQFVGFEGRAAEPSDLGSGEFG